MMRGLSVVFLFVFQKKYGKISMLLGLAYDVFIVLQGCSIAHVICACIFFLVLIMIMPNFSFADYGAYGQPRMEMGISEMYGMNYGPDRDYGGGPRSSPYNPPGRLPLP